MTVLLNVTTTPQVFSSSVFGAVASSFNTAVYRFSFTPSLVSTNGAYSGFKALLGQAHGGVWLTSGAVELYTAPADTLCFSHAITWSAGQKITVVIDTRSGSRSVKISGATTGNGTFTFTQAGPYYDSTSGLEVGQFGSGQFTFTGTISAVDDNTNQIDCGGGTFALSGGAATLRAARTIQAGGGSLALTGGASTFLTGKTISPATGNFTLTGGVASFSRSLAFVAGPGSYALTGGDAVIQSGPTLAIGAHGVDFQIFGHANRNASLTLNTQPTGSVIVIAAGGKSSDVTQTWTSNKGTITKLASVSDYPDYAGYGTQVGQTKTGGTSHTITIPVTNFDENTTFVTEVVGGRRVKTSNTNVANASGGATLTSATVTTDGPAVLIADWWGSSPTVPPFSGTPPVGTPYTAVPNNGFTVLDSYLVNNQDGEVQACRAFKSVSAAGSYNVTWSQTPNQGGQTWLTTVQPAATISAGGGTLALTGGAATLRVSRTLAGAGASYSLTGGSTTMFVSRAISAGGGTLALSGGSATLRAARVLSGSGTGYSLTGGVATLLAARTVQTVGGALVLTGGSAVLRAARVLAVGGGSVAFTGGQASLRASRTVQASGGVLVLSGNALTLRAARVLALEGGSLGLSGGVATLLESRTMSCGGGAFSLTGGPTTIAEGRVFDLGSGALVLNGGDAQFHHIRRVVAAGGALVLDGGSAVLRAARRVNTVGGAVSLTGGDATIVIGSRVFDLLGGTLVLVGGNAALVTSTPSTIHRPFSSRRTIITTRSARVTVRS